MDDNIVFRMLATAVIRAGGEMTISYDDINRPVEIEVENGDHGVTLRATLADESE